MKYKDDVIIIGSGIGGLTCGAYLAKNGYKVKIFERLNQPGGYVNTFKRKDYWFEGSTHQLVGFKNKLYLYNELKKLGLNLPFIELNDSFESIQFDKNHNIIKRFLIKSGYKNAINSFYEYFPNERDVIKDIFTLLNKISIESLKLRNIANYPSLLNLFDLLMGLFLKINKKQSFLKKIGYNYFKHFLKNKDKVYCELLELINEKDLKYLLSIYSYFYILSSPKNISAVLMSQIIYNLILNKPLFIKGGTKIFINELIKLIKNHNGEINYNCNVKEIIIENCEAKGVLLDNNTKHFAKYIISNSNAFATYNNLIHSMNKFPDDLKNKIDQYKTSKSSFQIYLGLPFNLKEYGYNASTMFLTNNTDIEDLYLNDDNKSENNTFVLTNYTMMDKNFSPKGKSSIIIAQFDNNFKQWINFDENEYKIEKEKKQNEILRKIEKITGLPLYEAEVCFSATPKTMYYYSGKKNGAIYGVEKSIKDISIFDIQSPYKNLFLTGADTGNTGSINSSFNSGFVVANKIIKNSK